MRLEDAGRCAMADPRRPLVAGLVRPRAATTRRCRSARARLRPGRAPTPLRRPARRAGLRRRDLPHAARGAPLRARRGVQRSRVHPARGRARAHRRRRARRAGRADAGRAHRRAADLSSAGRVAAAHGVHRLGGVAAARADRRGARREHLGDGRRGRARRPVRHGTGRRRRRTRRPARAPRHARSTAWRVRRRSAGSPPAAPTCRRRRGRWGGTR